MNSALCFGNRFPRGAVNVLVLVMVAAGYLSACGGGAGASNTAPVANAGPDQNVTTGTSVTLDGSASTDPNGDLLGHSWLLMSKPSGSAATLYVPGIGWEGGTLIETGVDEADQPKVSINRNGTAITVWRSGAS
jgi:hypothetical protein